MTARTQTLRQLKGGAQVALLLGCLSFLLFQQIGHGAGAVLDMLLLQSRPAAAPAINTAGDAAKGAALSRDSLAPACEAVLTERKTLVLSASQPKPPAPRTLGIFHNNCRPVVLRTYAIFCDFARLRHILHPHLALLAHTSSVLC